MFNEGDLICFKDDEMRWGIFTCFSDDGSIAYFRPRGLYGVRCSAKIDLLKLG